MNIDFIGARVELPDLLGTVHADRIGDGPLQVQSVNDPPGVGGVEQGTIDRDHHFLQQVLTRSYQRLHCLFPAGQELPQFDPLGAGRMDRPLGIDPHPADQFARRQGVLSLYLQESLEPAWRGDRFELEGLQAHVARL